MDKVPIGIGFFNTVGNRNYSFRKAGVTLGLFLGSEDVCSSSPKCNMSNLDQLGSQTN